jgi:hypothetical protein
MMVVVVVALEKIMSRGFAIVFASTLRGKTRARGIWIKSSGGYAYGKPEGSLERSLDSVFIQEVEIIHI